MPSEADLEAKDRDAAKRDGWFVEKVMRCGRDGFPDRFYARAKPEDVCPCCGRGRVILIEWKRPPSQGRRGGVLSPQQVRRIDELRAAGVEVHVVDNLADAARVRSSL